MCSRRFRNSVIRCEASLSVSRSGRETRAAIFLVTSSSMVFGCNEGGLVDESVVNEGARISLSLPDAGGHYQAHSPACRGSVKGVPAADGPCRFCCRLGD